MTTERMNNEVLAVAEMTITKVLLEVHRARRVEQEQAEKIRKLEEMLRLAHDKVAEQVRQARWEVAQECLDVDPPYIYNALARIRDANAPKD